MSEGRQFQDFSNGMLRLTTTTWTIKLQSQTASLFTNTSEVTSLCIELSCASFFFMCSTTTERRACWIPTSNQLYYTIFLNFFKYITEVKVNYTMKTLKSLNNVLKRKASSILW